MYIFKRSSRDDKKLDNNIRLRPQISDYSAVPSDFDVGKYELPCQHVHDIFPVSDVYRLVKSPLCS